MTRTKTILAFGVAAFLCGLIGCCWVMFTPHAVIAKKPMTLAEAQKRFGLAELPATACNIYFAHASRGMGGRAHLLKFEAPPDDCREYAIKEYTRYNRVFYRDPKEYPLVEIVPAELPLVMLRNLSNFGLRNIGWFNPDKIRTGLTVKCGGQHNYPDIWIDTDRNILYVQWTD